MFNSNQNKENVYKTEEIDGGLYNAFILVGLGDELEEQESSNDEEILYLTKEIISGELLKKSKLLKVELETKQTLYFLMGIYSNEYNVYVRNEEIRRFLIKLDGWLHFMQDKKEYRTNREGFRVDIGVIILTKYRKGQYVELQAVLDTLTKTIYASLTSGGMGKSIEIEELDGYFEECAGLLWQMESIKIIQEQDVSYFIDVLIRMMLKGNFKSKDYINTREFEKVFEKIIFRDYDTIKLIENSDESDVKYLFIEGYHVLKLNENIYITENLLDLNAYKVNTNAQIEDVIEIIAQSEYEKIKKKALLMVQLLKLDEN